MQLDDINIYITSLEGTLQPSQTQNGYCSCKNFKAYRFRYQRIEFKASGWLEINRENFRKYDIPRNKA